MNRSLMGFISRFLMNEIELSFPVKAVSVNHYRQNNRSGKPYITKKGKAYKKEMEFHLSHQSHKLAMFFMDLDDSKDFVEVEIAHFHTDLFTKKGDINSRCIDVDNCCKLILDYIFNHSSKDDKCVRKVVVEKYYDSHDHIEVRLSRSMPLITNCEELMLTQSQTNFSY